MGHPAEVLPEAELTVLSEEEGYSVLRVRLRVLEELTLTGLLFRAHGEGKRPLAIVQHGGAGTPELISGIYGSTGNYNDMLHRVRAQGLHVFAPQLLLWTDDHEVPFDRKELDASLKQVGSSITAVEVYGIMRALDYFEAQDYVSTLGMVGLSYGGFYTLFTAALDTRIRSAVSCSFFNSREHASRSDWTWFDAARCFDDAEIACLVYPRRLCVAVGENDPLFLYSHAEEALRRLRGLCAGVGTDWLEIKPFEGVHEFFKDDAPLVRLARDLLEET